MSERTCPSRSRNFERVRFGILDAAALEHAREPLGSSEVGAHPLREAAGVVDLLRDRASRNDDAGDGASRERCGAGDAAQRCHRASEQTRRAAAQARPGEGDIDLGARLRRDANKLRGARLGLREVDVRRRRGGPNFRRELLDQGDGFFQGVLEVALGQVAEDPGRLVLRRSERRRKAFDRRMRPLGPVGGSLGGALKTLHELVRAERGLDVQGCDVLSHTAGPRSSRLRCPRSPRCTRGRACG
jgi:hypothetical protein